MASSVEFVEYAAGQLAAAGEITYKRMFGEYGLYCNGVYFAVVCDNQLFIKPTAAGRQLAQQLSWQLEEAPPYAGAKDCLLIDDLEERERLAELVRATCQELSQNSKPKAKTKTNKEKPTAQRQPVFDYKKEYKEFYLPKRQPGLVEVPAMQFAAVRGQGDPNQEGGEYKRAVGWLYAAAYAIKMSKMGDRRIEGYFDFVVPPLEGLWWQEDNAGGVDYSQKNNFQWWALIRLPEFVSDEDFAWAAAKAAEKDPAAAGRLQLFHYAEGLCVQCLHVGPYDNEPETLAAMREFAAAQGYAPDLSGGRRHHEIYLSDPRRCKPENLKTVIRLPLIAEDKH